MFTVRGEITKWMINEGVIKSTNDVKNLSYKSLLDFYFECINKERTILH